MLANNNYINATCDISQRAGLLKYIQGKGWIVGLKQGGVLLPSLERTAHTKDRPTHGKHYHLTTANIPINIIQLQSKYKY